MGPLSMIINTTITISTFNCKNVRSSWDEIKLLCKDCDILFLQETWLLETDLVILSQIDPDFYCKGLSSMDSQNKLHLGRPFGGLAVLWRKSLGACVNPVVYDDNRLLGAELMYDHVKILLISVYLPCSSSLNQDDFLHYLSKIDSIVTTSDSAYMQWSSVILTLI